MKSRFKKKTDALVSLPVYFSPRHSPFMNFVSESSLNVHEDNLSKSPPPQRPLIWFSDNNIAWNMI